MKKLEYLFPETANLYGDTFNVKYFKECMGDKLEVIHTALTEKPHFVTEEVDMIYMSSMSEKTQELVIEALKPYKEIIEELIKKGTIFLLTGNSMEVFENYIENEDGTKIEGLGIIDLYAKRDMMHRFNTLFLGKFNDFEILGHKATFSFSYGDNTKNYAFESIKGCGINKESELEGVKINNFFATYLIGPLLILNPQLTKYFMKLLGEENPKLKYEELEEECFKQRLEEFKREGTNYLQ